MHKRFILSVITISAIILFSADAFADSISISWGSDGHADDADELRRNPDRCGDCAAGDRHRNPDQQQDEEKHRCNRMRSEK